MIVPVTYTGTTPTEVVRGAYTYIIVDTHTGLQVGKPYRTASAVNGKGKMRGQIDFLERQP